MTIGKELKETIITLSNQAGFRWFWCHSNQLDDPSRMSYYLHFRIFHPKMSLLPPSLFQISGVYISVPDCRIDFSLPAIDSARRALSNDTSFVQIGPAKKTPYKSQYPRMAHPMVKWKSKMGRTLLSFLRNANFENLFKKRLRILEQRRSWKRKRYISLIDDRAYFGSLEKFLSVGWFLVFSHLDLFVFILTQKIECRYL